MLYDVKEFILLVLFVCLFLFVRRWFSTPEIMGHSDSEFKVQSAHAHTG